MFPTFCVSEAAAPATDVPRTRAEINSQMERFIIATPPAYCGGCELGDEQPAAWIAGADAAGLPPASQSPEAPPTGQESSRGLLAYGSAPRARIGRGPKPLRLPAAHSVDRNRHRI